MPFKIFEIITFYKGLTIVLKHKKNSPSQGLNCISEYLAAKIIAAVGTWITRASKNGRHHGHPTRAAYWQCGQLPVLSAVNTGHVPG